MTMVILCRQCNFTVLAKNQESAISARAKHELESNDYLILIREVQNIVADSMKVGA